MLGLPTKRKENVSGLHAPHEFRFRRHRSLRLFLRPVEGIRQKAQTAKAEESSSNW